MIHVGRSLKTGIGGKYFMEIISGWLSQVSVLEWERLPTPLASDEETKPRKCVTCECIFFLKQQKECINNSVAPQLAAA